MELRDGVETLSEDGQSPWATLPGLGEEERRGVYYYAILPNLLLNLHPQYMLTFNLWPQAHDHTEIVCRWYFHPQEVARDDFDPTSAVTFLGSHQSSGLGGLRARPAGDRLTSLSPRSLLQSRRAALGPRPLRGRSAPERRITRTRVAVVRTAQPSTRVADSTGPRR